MSYVLITTFSILATPSKFLRTTTMQCFTITSGEPSDCRKLRKGGSKSWTHRFCTRSNVDNHKLGTCQGDSGGKIRGHVYMEGNKLKSIDN